MTEKKGRGRPAFKPKAGDGDRVSVLRAGGMSADDIASAFGITKPTLYKHFAFELDQGWHLKRGEIIEAMHKAASNGNVSAQGKFLTLVKEAELVPPMPKEPKAPKLGKKEEAEIAAHTAHESTAWGELVH